MRILDCESYNSTIVSLSNILAIPKDALLGFLKTIDYFKSDSRWSIPVDDYLFGELMESHRINTEYDRVCWFHLSRTLNYDLFKEGIKPLNMMIDYIWESLYSLVQDSLSKEEWAKIRIESFKKTKDKNSAYLYAMKTSNEMHWGPYAMLIRDVAFHSKEIANHDYLKIPEIVEDICSIIHSYNRLDLSTLYVKKSKPVIVKFYEQKCDIEYLKVALTYLYYSVNGFGFSIETNTCYDGNGITVPYEHILKIGMLN